MAAGEMVGAVTEEAMAVGTSKAGTVAGEIVSKADAETLYALIQEKAKDSPIVHMLLLLGEFEGWTVQHTALAIAFTLVIKDEDNTRRMIDMVSKSTRPILMSLHCKTCTCEDKGVNYEDV